jgi:heme-degrading monooxygenase HmoA
MFPPPTPWKQRAAVDPNRENVAFTSPFFLKSVRRVPAFIASSRRIMKQANQALGIIGWSLGMDLFKREFHTLSVWEDADSLRRFVRDGSHRAAVEALARDVRRKSIFVYSKVWGRDLPLTWKFAIARQRRQNQG